MEKYIVNKETMMVTYMEDGEVIYTHKEKTIEELEATIKHLKDFNGSNHELEIIEKIEIVHEFKSAKEFNTFFKYKDVKSVKAVVWEDQDGAYIEVYAELEGEDFGFETIAYSKGGDVETLLKKLNKVSAKYKKWVAESWYMDCELEVIKEIQYV